MAPHKTNSIPPFLKKSEVALACANWRNRKLKHFTVGKPFKSRQEKIT